LGFFLKAIADESDGRSVAKLLTRDEARRIAEVNAAAFKAGSALLYAGFRHASRLFPGSSAVEQPAVNRLVAGSNPARGAKSPLPHLLIAEGLEGGMKQGVITIAIAMLVMANAAAANAQSVSGRVTGTVGEVGSVAGQATAGTGPSGSQSPPSSNLPTGSLVGGELPGGVKMKLGDKVIDLRGNVGVGDNGGNFKAGVGLPF
jgi:hypothetical protein